MHFSNIYKHSDIVYLHSINMLIQYKLRVNKNDSYINEEFAWNSFVYDLMSICCFNLQKYDEALMYVREALKLDKNNLRLQLNLEEMEKHINKKSDN